MPADQVRLVQRAFGTEGSAAEKATASSPRPDGETPRRMRGADDFAAASHPRDGEAGAAGGAAGSGGATPRKNHPYNPDDYPKPQSGADNIQFTWPSAVFTCVVAAACLWYFDFITRQREDKSRATVQNERIGTPRLGGPFELLDRTGKVVTDQDLRGQYLLLYFGFTFCPDICPQEMEKASQAIELLDAEFGPVATPVFISVDPKRDTPPQVNEYCSEFHPRLVGLTGTPEQVKKVSRAYRVYYNEGIKSDEQDYLIDHSIIHYFVNDRGQFVDFFGKNMTAKEMAQKMKITILEDRAKAKSRKERRGVEDVE